jgi:hypothetical protein
MLNELEEKIIPIRRIIHAKSGILSRLSLAKRGGGHSIYNSVGLFAEILETISVDDLGANLGVKFDVIKIDVEGAEVDLLKGAEQTLTYAREVIMEYHSRRLYEESVKILRAYGFNCKTVNPKRFLNKRWLIGYLLLNSRLILHGQIPNVVRVCGQMVNINDHQLRKPTFHDIDRGILYAHKPE